MQCWILKGKTPSKLNSKIECIMENGNEPKSNKKIKCIPKCWTFEHKNVIKSPWWIVNWLCFYILITREFTLALIYSIYIYFWKHVRYVKGCIPLLYNSWMVKKNLMKKISKCCFNFCVLLSCSKVKKIIINF